MSVNYVQTPTSRRLRGYAFDPSLSIQLDTTLVNETVFSFTGRNAPPIYRGDSSRHIRASLKSPSVRLNCSND